MNTDQIGMAIIAGMWRNRQSTETEYWMQVNASKALGLGISARKFVPSFQKLRRQGVLQCLSKNSWRLNPTLLVELEQKMKRWRKFTKAGRQFFKAKSNWLAELEPTNELKPN